MFEPDDDDDVSDGSSNKEEDYEDESFEEEGQEEESSSIEGLTLSTLEHLSESHRIKTAYPNKTFSPSKIREIERQNAILMNKILHYSGYTKMHTRGLIFWLILSVYRSDGSTPEQEGNTDRLKSRDNLKSTYSANDLLSTSLSDVSTCSIDDFACLAMAANDRLGLEAIKTLHQKLDDDANGNVDLTESDDFLREELQYDSGYERRQKAFHRNDDMHISVKELWEAWLKSEVHNWTVEQTTEWLISSVDLPQYVPSFITHKVTGANLPRLAANNINFLNHLGIKDPIHKQKIVLKAMDVVLFGPPKGMFLTPHPG
ncbi:SAM 2 domain containing protein [Asbolus verrucosus]|uniref:SAM 2 domain containing protein n=1 Tax=Asbolus verrucosus TaxID=1661398 RepID=A0A482VIX3_ASBVE|nr:SAM 2 domain containing protein [Asbolus verrucosus]